MISPTERVLSALKQCECNPRKNAKGWSARCPAHEDRRPSLSVAEGDDGRVLLTCHAGCTFNAICEALRLNRADLTSAANGVDTDTTLSAPGKTQVVSTINTFPNADDAVKALERRHGKISCQWIYHNVSGKPVGVVLRWDKPDGKSIRPVAKLGNKWVIGGMDKPRPLYRLPDLAAATQVFICEGEKAADAATSIGLVATTSAHGAQSPKSTDWSPLVGREIAILPDNDVAGQDYANTVAGILRDLDPSTAIKVVQLPGLPSGGDVYDWINNHGDAAEPDDLVAQIKVLTDQTELIKQHPPETPVGQHDEQPRKTSVALGFRPFPTKSLPYPVREYVEAGAAAIGCDPSYVALPLLSALAAAIGSTRRVRLKPGWDAPSIIWTCIVGESGTHKSPAFKLAKQYIENFQHDAIKDCESLISQYQVDLALYEKDYAKWKCGNKNESELPPSKPECPTPKRFLVSDTTVEALAQVLAANLRGVLLARDELSGWIGSFDRYTGGHGGGDAAHWLSMHNGDPITVDRKTGNPPLIHVSQTSVSVAGGIQPTILHRVLGAKHRESGLAARFLLACPPRKPKSWSEKEIDPILSDEMRSVFDALYQLQSSDNDDNLDPVVITLDQGAKQAWINYFNTHAKEQSNLTGELSAAWSKLEEYAARLALVVHCVREATDDKSLHSDGSMDETSMTMGIELATWFKHETRRVYSQLSETVEEQDQRALAELIERKGGQITTRELMRSGRNWKTAPDAEQALNSLVDTGAYRWAIQKPTDQGGRPTQICELINLPSVDTTCLNPGKTTSCVSVDSVNTIPVKLQQ